MSFTSLPFSFSFASSPYLHSYMYSPELDHDSDWSEWPPWGYKRGGPDPQWAIITAGFAGAIGVGLVLKHFKGRSWYMAPAIAAQFGKSAPRVEVTINKLIYLLNGFAGLTMLLLTRFISGSEWTHIAYAFDRLFVFNRILSNLLHLAFVHSLTHLIVA